MAEAPIDLSRPSPPALIPIRRFKRTPPTRRDFHKDASNQERNGETRAESESVPGGFPGQPSWSCDIQARLGVPTLTTLQASRKVLRVCVNNNSIPPSSAAPLTESRVAADAAAMLSEDTTAPLNESSRWSWLANLSRSHSVPNVTQSPRELCPRRKAMSEERVTEGSSDDGYDIPSKRRRYEHPLECSRDCSSEQAWASQISRRSMTGRHVRSGTGAAPATLKGLRDKILSRRLSAAAGVR